MSSPKKKSSLQALLDAQEQAARPSASSSNHQGLYPPPHQQPQWDRNARDRGSSWRGPGGSTSGRRRPEASEITTTTTTTTNSRWANVNINDIHSNTNSNHHHHHQTYSTRDNFLGRDDDISTWIGPLSSSNGTCTYYQDRSKRYPFSCKKRGYDLLQMLLHENAALLNINHERILELAATNNNNTQHQQEQQEQQEQQQQQQQQQVTKIQDIGKALYADKPTLHTKGVTWSTEEYSHPGFQRMYLRMKSIQRFTEMYALLERAAKIGVFHEYSRNTTDHTKPLRIAALGGGPGYELLAAKLFFQERAPDLELDLICMDVCAAWRPYAEQLGFRFVEYDILHHDTPLLEAAGLEKPGDLDFCMVSCVMIYVTNDRTIDMFYTLLHDDGVQAMLLNERGETTRACSMMEDRGGVVVRLMDQTFGVDERQTILCSKEFQKAHDLDQGYSQHVAKPMEPTFPNVPFEEHKQKRRPFNGQRGHG